MTALFVPHSEALFLVDDEQAQIPKLHILGEQREPFCVYDKVIGVERNIRKLEPPGTVRRDQPAKSADRVAKLNPCFAHHGSARTDAR